MSKTTSTFEGIDTVVNSVGITVPAASDQHLKWWFEQIAHIEVKLPDSDVMGRFLKCCTNEVDTTPVPVQIRSTFALQVFEKRMKALDMVATPWLSVFITTLCSNPAEVVMWAFFMKIFSITSKSRLVSLQDLGLIFPQGLPTKEGMNWAWDLQKLNTATIKGFGVDNLLDRVTMQSHEA